MSARVKAFIDEPLGIENLSSCHHDSLCENTLSFSIRLCKQTPITEKNFSKTSWVIFKNSQITKRHPLKEASSQRNVYIVEKHTTKISRWSIARMSALGGFLDNKNLPKLCINICIKWQNQYHIPMKEHIFQTISKKQIEKAGKAIAKDP